MPEITTAEPLATKDTITATGPRRDAGADGPPPSAPTPATPGGRARRLYLTDHAASTGEYFGSLGVPARDLEPEDIDALDDATYAAITERPDGFPAIYQKTKPKSRAQD